MRIAVVTSFARGMGGNGEDLAVVDQVNLLRAAGHEVLLLSRASDAEMSRRGYPIRAGLTVATGWGPDPLPRIEAFGPDVIHVHNTYPNIGRNWARRCTFPLVITLHSFRYFCAAGTFFRDGAVCTDCLHTPLSATRHGCYEGRLRSLPYSVAGMRRRSDALIGSADRIIALNPTMRSILISSGVDEDRVVEGINTVMPSSTVWEPGNPDHAIGRDSHDQPWLFVGRLIAAKGILRLLRSWPEQAPLWIVGDGPLRREIDAFDSDEVRILGHLSRSEISLLMTQSRGLIVPSLWFEGQPLVYLEALAAGLPTIAYQPNAVAELVARDGTGMVASWADDLSAVLSEAEAQFPNLRNHCRDVFERQYTPEVYLTRLEETYREAIENRGHRP